MPRMRATQGAVAEQAKAGPGVYGGLFFTTLSTLTYEILLTRIFSVTMWYHFAFVAVSVACVGESETRYFDLRPA
ncbi:MAG: hypothetical protein IIB88_10020 [Chloroflexi bacterium]|nr:hypothetical protein [Chloroflexota bacterium]